jgi:hypothetical protein
VAGSARPTLAKAMSSTASTSRFVVRSRRNLLFRGTQSGAAAGERLSRASRHGRRPRHKHRGLARPPLV